MMKCVLIQTTCPSQKHAKTLARALIERRLAACIHIQKIASLYSWNNKLCRDTEYELSVKTTAGQSQNVQKFIQAHHPYDLPQIIEIPVTGGSDDYLKWVYDQTK